jgi:tetratricopeptide (TPR) repeat protein
LVKQNPNKGGQIAVNIPSMQLVIRALSLSFAASLLVVTVSHAQAMSGGRQATPGGPSTDMQQTELHELTDVQRQPGVTIDTREQKAYDAFFHAENSDKKIQLGNAFLEKYPKSIFTEAVDSGLAYAYYDKQDWKDYYATADKALTLKPDDVDLLASVGWVIPHFYNPQDANADQQLNKAETCEKHAIEVMATMPKPASLTDAQFAAAKAQKAAQAHSALGLVYFRREDYANSAKELQEVTQNSSNADQTDLFVLGMDFQNMDKFGDAADAFGRCSQIAGNLQDRCKQNADLAKKQAAQPK